MYLVAIAWMYVVLMIAVAEALSSNGSVLGAIVTFVFWGLLPLGVLLYVMGTPMRRRARLAAEASATDTTDAVLGTGAGTGASEGAAEGAPEGGLAGARPVAPDGRGHAPGDAVAAERKEV